MRFSSMIESLSDLPMLPIILTDDNRDKYVRAFGVFVYMPWFFIGCFIWAVIAAILAVPAMIQDA